MKCRVNGESLILKFPYPYRDTEATKIRLLV